MVSYRNYRISDLDVRPSIVFAPDAFLALDYSGAPTQFQLEREIENNLHTNQDLQVGCPVCGNVDLFTREINTKGRRFRCGYCFYNSDSEFESVKSQKDITLSKFGLLYECQICGEAIDSYNRGTVLRHIKKHQDEAKVLEAETQNKITHGVAVLQPDNSKVTGVVYFADAGSGVAISYRIKGLSDGEHGFHIHEYGDLTDGCTSACAHFNPDNEVHGGLETPVRHFGDLGNIESQKSISEGEIYLPKAKLDSSKYGILGRMMIVHADRDDLGKGGDAESLKTGNAGKRLACGVIGLAEPPTHKKAESKMNLELDQQDPNDPNRMWGPDVISPIFPLKGHERPVEEVRADLKKHLVGQQIKMWHDSNDKGFSKDFGFSEPQPSGTWGKVTGVSDSNPNMPWVIGVWVTITDGGSPKHPVGSRVWFHVKDSHFPTSMYKGWYEGDYLKAEGIRECCECSTTEGLTTIQAGTFCWNCLPINLGAEDDYDSTYGKAQAKIRRKLKNKIKQQAIMGTKAGQWSARKSQELKRQYEAACSKKGLKPYKGQKTKSQDNLSKWSKQGWKTASGKKSSVTGEPYFPAKAVTALKQKNLYAKAKRQKQAATKAGKQNARYSDDIRAVVRQYRSEETLITTSEIKSLLRDLKDTEVDWEDVDWETDEPPIDESWLDEVEWDAEECAVCRITIEAGDGDLCEVCWESYEQSLQPTKVTTEWWAEDSTSPNQWQILNWIVKSPVPVPNKEPLKCLECKSANIEGMNTWENEGDSFAYRDVVCNKCGCIWMEVWHYQESEIREHGDQYHLPESKRFSAPYQPNQTLLDYSPYEMATSSVITGDFFTDSLKYGFGPESKSSENVR